MLLQGCYETLPLQQGPPPSTVTVQLSLNDKGRVAVADKLGTGVGKVEGVVTAQDAQSYTVAVSHVMLTNGNVSTWNGELVTVAKDGTDGYQVHRYNKSKTLALVASITVAAVVLFLTVGLHGFGNDNGSGSGGNGNLTR